jgi:hypothetical protein
MQPYHWNVVCRSIRGCNFYDDGSTQRSVVSLVRYLPPTKLIICQRSIRAGAQSTTYGDASGFRSDRVRWYWTMPTNYATVDIPSGTLWMVFIDTTTLAQAEQINGAGVCGHASYHFFYLFNSIVGNIPDSMLQCSVQVRIVLYHGVSAGGTETFCKHLSILFCSVLFCSTSILFCSITCCLAANHHYPSSINSCCRHLHPHRATCRGISYDVKATYENQLTICRVAGTTADLTTITGGWALSHILPGGQRMLKELHTCTGAAAVQLNVLLWLKINVGFDVD